MFDGHAYFVKLPRKKRQQDWAEGLTKMGLMCTLGGWSPAWYHCAALTSAPVKCVTVSPHMFCALNGITVSIA
ncbi:MAG: hypothetical protein ACTS7I_03085 [Candidatus Hodgkinia cicadicola]